MKKTKVLIPALGILLLSTAATVSGSLAWFTANRSVTVDTDYFAVQSIDGNLRRDMAGIASCGTQVQVTDKYSNEQVVEPVEYETDKPVSLTDASFNYAEKELFTDVPSDAADTQPNQYKKISNLTDKKFVVEGSENKVYYAFAWTVTFAYDFQSDTTPMDIFFDVNNSKCEAKKTKTSEAHDTKLGFRIAMVAASTNPTEANAKDKVWLPYRASTDEVATNKHRVVSASSTDAYAATIAIYSDSATITDSPIATKALDKTNGNRNRLDYLGTVKSDSTGVVAYDKTLKSTTLAYTFVAWFEGCDADVVNDTLMNEVQAGMKFYARQAYVA